jgi:hypothetical protein
MSRSRLAFSPDEARTLLWARCLEEADATGALIPVEARAAASREANDPDDAAFLLRRAAILTRSNPALAEPPVLAESWPGRLPHWTPWALAAAAFVLGWWSNELGPHRQISLLSFPLLGLILWNLTVCGASLWAEWTSAKKKRAAAEPAFPRRMPAADAMAAAGAEFTARAAAWERPRRHARLKWMFHAAAIALALGVVAGMYVRGLAKEYTASWQSTFLNRSHVRALTATVLGPASLVTGIAVPDPLEKDTPQDAAPWIHLWAASAGLFIVVPRLLLANIARLQAQRSRPDYNEEFGSWLELGRALASGQTRNATVLPVHCEPEPKMRDSLRLILQHLWGVDVRAGFLPPLPYGAEGFSLTPIPEFLAVMVPLATTPESEIHGALLTSLAGAGPERRQRLLVLDASGFEARFRSLPEYPQRLAARRALWEKMSGGDFPVLLLDDAARRDPAGAARSVFST